MSRCHSGLTATEIGLILGLSRQRVEQLERNAIRKLRKAAGSTYFGPYKIRDTVGIAENSDTRDRSNRVRRDP